MFLGNSKKEYWIQFSAISATFLKYYWFLFLSDTGTGILEFETKSN